MEPLGMGRMAWETSWGKPKDFLTCNVKEHGLDSGDNGDPFWGAKKRL